MATGSVFAAPLKAIARRKIPRAAQPGVRGINIASSDWPMMLSCSAISLMSSWRKAERTGAASIKARVGVKRMGDPHPSSHHRASTMIACIGDASSDARRDASMRPNAAGGGNDQ